MLLQQFRYCSSFVTAAVTLLQQLRYCSSYVTAAAQPVIQSVNLPLPQHSILQSLHHVSPSHRHSHTKRHSTLLMSTHNKHLWNSERRTALSFVCVSVCVRVSVCSSTFWGQKYGYGDNFVMIQGDL